MRLLCYICKKSYANKASLAAHKSRYHRSTEKISNGVDGKVLLSQSTFGDSISSRGEHIKENLSDESEDTDESENTDDSQKSKFKVKNVMKKRYLTDEMSEDSEVEHKRGNKRMRSLEDILSSNKPFKEQADEYLNNLQRENQTLSEANQKNRIARELEEQNTADKEETITELGKDQRNEPEKRNINTSIRNVEGRCLIHELVLEDLEKKYKDLKDSQGYKEVISIGIPYMEIVLYNSVEIRDLFKENNYKGIQFSIEKLRNAAKFASQFFTCLGNITHEDHNLLDTLSESSIFDARSLLDQNYSSLKSMFTELPAFDILKDTVTKIKEGASSKHGRDISFHNKDIKNNNTLSDEESSKTAKIKHQRSYQQKT